MTRATLLRVVLAISCYAKGDASTGRLWLPRKWKIRYLDPMVIWSLRESMKILARTPMRRIDWKSGGQKIGDTIVVRKPGRYFNAH